MGKVSRVDKLRMQTLSELGLGAKAIIHAYPHKQWKLSTVQKICHRVDASGSAVERQAGSGTIFCVLAFFISKTVGLSHLKSHNCVKV